MRNMQSIAHSASWWESTKRYLGLGGDAKVITRSEFLAACQQHEEFWGIARKMLASRKFVENPTAEEIFDIMDADGNGVLDTDELERLIKMEYDGSTLRYMSDTVSVT